jgi:hypothetical protein
MDEESKEIAMHRGPAPARRRHGFLDSRSQPAPGALMRIAPSPENAGRMKRAGRRVRRVLSALTAAGVALLTVATVGVIRSGPAPGTLLAAGTDFTITSAITPWPSCTGGTALFYPGVTRCITYTAKNSLAVPIMVKTINLALDTTTVPTPPPGCPPGTNLDTSHSNFSGSFTVAASPATASSPGLAIKMLDNGNQNVCQGVAFHFKYTGSALYTDPTTTTLTSSMNPANFSQAITYTATVKATIPQTLAGSVTFKDNGNPIASCGTGGAVPLNASAMATCTITYNQPVTHPITAVFTATDSTNFSSSTSNTVNEVVGQPAATCAVTLSGTVTTITGTYNGNYEVKSGNSLYLNGGKITGNVTVDAGGKFVASGGSVGGNLVSSGGPTTMQGTTVSGHIQTSNASLGLGAGTNVKSTVTITGGGPVCIDGTTSSNVQIGGNLDVEQLSPNLPTSTICGATVTGNLTYSNNSQVMRIGISSSCPGNTISGNLTVQSNGGQVSVGAPGTGLGNSVGGSISVQSNTGGGYLTNNSAANQCTLQKDTPGIVGSQNTAKGANTCNRTA